MDSWPPSESHRHKRSFNEMSQQVTLSPSPIHSLFGLASFSPFTRSAPANNNIPGPSHRRISHPHNPPQLFRRPSEDMPERAQLQQRPRLQHQASQTLTIDLTDEPEDLPPAPRNRDRARSQRPPQLGRSDAQALENIIDLTDDNDLEITASRQLPLPRPNVARPLPQAHIPRVASPSLFLRNTPPPIRERNRIFGHDGPHGLFDRVPHHHHIDAEAIMNFAQGLGGNFDHFQPFNNAQAMPGQMDYQRGAFADRKPDHVPPPPAKEGFTRSPTDEDVVVCPSCDEELVHKKDAEELLVTKKGGKAPTKKEREEHPFWVVKECGHVYCNNCYQHRASSSKSAHPVHFPERLSSSKVPKKSPYCAVEDCDSDVKGKEKWVGVFL